MSTNAHEEDPGDPEAATPTKECPAVSAHLSAHLGVCRDRPPPRVSLWGPATQPRAYPCPVTGEGQEGKPNHLESGLLPTGSCHPVARACLRTSQHHRAGGLDSLGQAVANGPECPTPAERKGNVSRDSHSFLHSKRGGQPAGGGRRALSRGVWSSLSS